MGRGEGLILNLDQPDGTNLKIKGFAFDAVIGVTTEYSFDFSTDIYLIGGILYAGQDGDTMEFGIATGLPAPNDWYKYVETMELSADVFHEFPFRQLTSGANIPANTPMRVWYTNNGSVLQRVRFRLEFYA